MLLMFVNLSKIKQKNAAVCNQTEQTFRVNLSYYRNFGSCFLVNEIVA